MEGFPTDVGSS